MSKPEQLGSVFRDCGPPEERNRKTEYWYWKEKTTVGKMTVTRDQRGRFVDFHYYEAVVVNGKEEKRIEELGSIFG